MRKLGLPDMYFLDQVCADPCRCSSRIPEAMGYTIHDAELGRAYCFVAEPEACTEGVTSLEHEGEVWRPCALEYDTCQLFAVLDPAKSPCGSFVESGSSAFVPKGETLESMQCGEHIGRCGDAKGVCRVAAVGLLRLRGMLSCCWRIHVRVVVLALQH